MNIEVNYTAVVIASIVSMALGFFWYSPMVLGKPWMKMMGYSEESLKKAQKEMGKYYLLSLVAAIVSAYVLSHVMSLSMNFYNYPRLIAGITSALMMWVGFVGPVQLTDTIFGSKNWKLFAINTGYQLVSLIAVGIVLAML